MVRIVFVYPCVNVFIHGCVFGREELELLTNYALNPGIAHTTLTLHLFKSLYCP